jgi:DNA mismatch repair protein MSH2
MCPDDRIKLKYSSLNKATFEKIVREILLVKNYRVEVYTHKNHDYYLAYKGSPGNLLQFENLLYSANETEMLSNLLLSLQLSTSGNSIVS